jgi:hypothetical protein
MQSTEWSARRILKEICSPEKRREVLISFWTTGDQTSRRLAIAHLAKSLRFREESLRKAPPEKKADLLASRIASPEFEEFFEAALLTYHVATRGELMAAFLDEWGIKHTNGSIDEDDYTVPGREAVAASVVRVRESHSLDDVILYLVTAGLVMGEGMPGWREATWPVVDELLAGRQSHAD